MTGHMNRIDEIEVSLSAWELHVLCEALERYPTNEAHKVALLYKLGESAERQMAARRRNRL
jgi:hypothetical protein